MNEMESASSAGDTEFQVSSKSKEVFWNYILGLVHIHIRELKICNFNSLVTIFCVSENW